MIEQVKNFYLNRKVDESGISGTGVVAVGTQFPSGICALEWTTYHSSVGIYKNVLDVEKIHGHNGATEVVWGVPGESTPKPKARRKKNSETEQV
jgi:hypothetical protein